MDYRADILDSRDLIERADELLDEREDLVAAVAEAEDEFTEANALANASPGDERAVEDALAAQRRAVLAQQALSDWLEENDDELDALVSLCGECKGYAEDWRHGVALVADDHFRDYAEELADEIGAVDRHATWPLSHIDWKAAAEELKQDYTSVTLFGRDYWYR